MASLLLNCLLAGALAASCGIAQQSAVDPIPSSAPDRSEAQRLLESLDAAFNQGDMPAFRRCFSPAHTRMHRLLMQRFERIIRPETDLRRSSELLRYWLLDDAGVALVRSETVAPGCRSNPPPVIEHCLLALRAAPSGTESRALATLCVEVGDRWLPALTKADRQRPMDEIGCPACNYHLKVAEGWLLVPNCARRAGCLESASFYAIDADLSGTISVHTAPLDADADLDPAQTLIELTGFRGSGAHPAPWSPPAHTKPDSAAENLRGARLSIPTAEGDFATEMYLATYGRLAYLLTLEGPAPTLRQQRATLDAMIAGFRLNDPKIDPDKLKSQVLAAHTGGRLDGVTYENPRIGVRIVGPKDWRPTHCADQYAFDVSWFCPLALGVLRAKGLQPPPGTDRWTTRAADQMLAQTLERSGMHSAEDSDWSAGDGAFSQTRELGLRGADGATVLLRLELAEDLLVILEADILSAEAEGPLRAAMDSLQRLN